MKKAVVTQCATHYLSQQCLQPGISAAQLFLDSQVKAIDLKGKNYCFEIRQTFQPIVPTECDAVASKSRKNILICLQVLIWPNNVTAFRMKHLGNQSHPRLESGFFLWVC